MLILSNFRYIGHILMYFHDFWKLVYFLWIKFRHQIYHFVNVEIDERQVSQVEVLFCVIFDVFYLLLQSLVPEHIHLLVFRFCVMFPQSYELADYQGCYFSFPNKHIDYCLVFNRITKKIIFINFFDNIVTDRVCFIDEEIFILQEWQFLKSAAKVLSCSEAFPTRRGKKDISIWQLGILTKQATNLNFTSQIIVAQQYFL